MATTVRWVLAINGHHTESALRPHPCTSTSGGPGSEPGTIRYDSRPHEVGIDLTLPGIRGDTRHVAAQFLGDAPIPVP